jgi:hypothetical protein
MPLPGDAGEPSVAQVVLPDDDILLREGLDQPLQQGVDFGPNPQGVEPGSHMSRLTLF